MNVQAPWTDSFSRSIAIIAYPPFLDDFPFFTEQRPKDSAFRFGQMNGLADFIKKASTNFKIGFIDGDQSDF